MLSQKNNSNFLEVKLLENAFFQQNILADDHQKAQIIRYLHLLQQWNKTYNLTAIIELNKMISHHIIDSLSILDYLENKPTLDFGSGAGLPGIPLAIMCPKQTFALLDSNGKKCRFLRQVVRELKLANIEVINDRIESLAKDYVYPQIICRAVSSLKNLIRFCIPACAEGGKILCMKGIFEQADTPENCIQETIPLNVPVELGERNLIRITRLST